MSLPVHFSRRPIWKKARHRSVGSHPPLLQSPSSLNRNDPSQIKQVLGSCRHTTQHALPRCVLHLRVRLPRASLAVSKQAGVESFEGPQQQRFGQRPIHRLLAGEGRVGFVHWAEGVVVREGVALFGVRMLDYSLLAIHEDDLQGFLSPLPLREKKRFRLPSFISLLKKFSV